jgi:hypothetical protein
MTNFDEAATGVAKLQLGSKYGQTAKAGISVMTTFVEIGALAVSALGAVLSLFLKKHSF